LAFDGDQAGLNATLRASRIALSLGMDVKIANMGEGVDPADLILKGGSEVWKATIKNSKHIIVFLLDRVLKNGDTRKVGREIKETILPYVDTLPSSIEKVHFLKIISDRSSIPLKALQEDLGKVEQDLKYEKMEIETVLESQSARERKDNILRRLLGIIFWQRTSTVKRIDVGRIMDELAQILKRKPDEILEKAEPEEGDLIFEAEVFYEGWANLESDVSEMLSNLKEEYLKEELQQKMRELHLAEEEKNFEKSSNLLQECQLLNNKIQEIKNGRLKK